MSIASTPTNAVRMRATIATATMLSAFVTARASAQSLIPSTGWSIAPVIAGWHFVAPINQSGGSIADVAEVALPFRIRGEWGAWRADLSGAGAFGAVHLSDGEGSLAKIYGPTDAKVRVSRTIFDEASMITLGVNLPSGKVKLNSSETTALQALAAPSLQMPVAMFGTGFGATLGAVHAIHGDDWAMAFAASGEKRSEYSPIALALGSGASDTRITPGMAAHLSVGYDRTLGANRVSALLVGDFYGKDLLQVGAASSDTSSNYTLGPQVTGSVQYLFGNADWREGVMAIGARARTEYSDATGKKVAGSSGKYLEASVGTVRGGPLGAGFVMGADVRWQSGLSFSDALIGAAMRGVGATVGVEGAGLHSATRLTLHGMYGTFDTGKIRTNGYGATLVFSVGARREAQQ